MGTILPGRRLTTVCVGAATSAPPWAAALPFPPDSEAVFQSIDLGAGAAHDRQGTRHGDRTYRTTILACGLVAGVVAAVVAAATPAQAIPIDPAGSSCASTSTASLQVSPSSIRLGQTTSVSWAFHPGTGCVATVVRLLFRDAIQGTIADTGIRGSSGSKMLAPQSSGTYFLRVVINGWFSDYGSRSVTIELPTVNGRPTVDITQPGQSALFAQAVGAPNAIVRIAGQVDLNLSYMDHIYVAPGVRIIGVRSPNSKGPRLFTTTFPRSLLDIGSSAGVSDNVRITGILLDGGESADPCDSAGAENADAITVLSSQRVEVDHDEMLRWRGSGVAVIDAGNRINQDNASSVWVHDNYIHDNQHPGYCGPDPLGSGHAGGYGVSVSQGAYALIERNVFDQNRHAIAGHGSDGDGYLLYRNLFLHPGVDNVKLGITTRNHQIDMHGQSTCGSGEHWNCGRAGEYMDVGWNTVVEPYSHAIQLRGTPSDPRGMSVHNNVFVQNRDAALTQTETGLKDDGGNLYGVYEPLTYLFRFHADTAATCDFDGDGTNDRFWATGVTWWYFSSLVDHYQFLNQSSSGTLGQHTLSDVNQDGLCDVTLPNGATFLTPQSNGASVDTSLAAPPLLRTQ
jgi:hypothetical protein